jgi:hypothetical protein
MVMPLALDGKSDACRLSWVGWSTALEEEEKKKKKRRSRVG